MISKGVREREREKPKYPVNLIGNLKHVLV